MAAAVSELTILAKCDYPPGEAVIKVAPTSSIAELRKKAASGLSMEVKDLAAYGLHSVAYLSNPIDLLANKFKDAKTIGDIGVKNRSVLFLRAPVDVKPAQKKRLPEEKERPSSYGSDRFSGLTVGNVLGKLKAAKGGKKKPLLEYIDIYTRDIVKEDDWVKLDKADLQAIVKSDAVNIPEIELFEACVRWGQHECKEKKLGSDEKALIASLKDVLEHIRFPLMPTEDIAAKLATTKFLSQEQVLDLFTFVGAADPGKSKLPKSLSMFSAKPRKPAKKPGAWKFAAHTKHPSLVLAEDGYKVTSSMSTAQMAVGDLDLNNGVHEWELKVNTLGSAANSLVVGVVPSTYADWNSNHTLGLPGQAPGWGWAVRTARKYNNGRTSYSAKRVAAGDTIRVRLDLDRSNLEFFVNGASQGMCFTNISAPVRPAISMMGSTSITLSFK